MVCRFVCLSVCLCVCLCVCVFVCLAFVVCCSCSDLFVFFAVCPGSCRRRCWSLWLLSLRLPLPISVCWVLLVQYIVNYRSNTTDNSNTVSNTSSNTSSNTNSNTNSNTTNLCQQPTAVHYYSFMATTHQQHGRCALVVAAVFAARRQ